MAIIKTTEKDTGVTVNYWNILGYDVKYVKDEGFSGIIKVAGYLDKKARETGKTLIEIKEYSIDKYFKSNDVMIRSLYAYLKTLGDFLGAEDD